MIFLKQHWKKIGLLLLLLAAPLVWLADNKIQSVRMMEAYNKGSRLFSHQQYDEAAPFLEHALQLGERIYGANDLHTAELLYSLGELYRVQKQYVEAGPLLERALAIRELALEPGHRDLLRTLSSIAENYRFLERHEEAEQFYLQFLTSMETALGPDHLELVIGLYQLAALYKHLLRDGEIGPLFARVLSIREKKLGPEHPLVAETLLDLGIYYLEQERYEKAEIHTTRALSIGEKTLGPGHPEVALRLQKLAAVYRSQSRYAEAEPLYRRSLEILEALSGPSHPGLATALSNLALLYIDQRRYKPALDLTLRALAVDYETKGSGHADTSVLFDRLATISMGLGLLTKAESYSKSALEIIEKEPGPDDTRTAIALNNLSTIYQLQKQYSKAEKLVVRSQTIWLKTKGDGHIGYATGLNNLAHIYQKQRRFKEALDLYAQSMVILKKTYGASHPSLAEVFSNIGSVHNDAGDNKKALKFYRLTTEIYQQRFDVGVGNSVGRSNEKKSVRFLFVKHVEKASEIAHTDPLLRTDLIAESFLVAQLARSTQAGVAISRMAARFAAGDDELGKVVRDHQDAMTAWQKLDTNLIEVVSQPPKKRNSVREKSLRTHLGDLDTQIKTLSMRISKEFPEYAEMTTAKPVPIADTQKLLGPEEAMVSYLVGEEVTNVWILRRDKAEMFTAEVGKTALQEAVDKLRDGLDPSLVQSLTDLPSFDSTVAHMLYEKIFAPAEKFLSGVHHVIMVPDGALQSIPPGVFLTKKPESKFNGISDFAKAPWLTKKYAMTTLPSVSSLRALRTFAKRTQATIPFTGIGDPLLKGHPGTSRGVKLASLYRGAVANVDEVRNLAPLPDTADELKALSIAVKGTPNRIYLRERATETAVKKMDLSDSRIVAFATHGLVAGDLENAEPALILTPPEIGTPLDDGLLTASEIAKLKLNADLVILSACNTAAGDGTDGAEGLSGLAKAFFYAGTRALLVSHWPVFSEAAVKLTTGMLRYQSKYPMAGRAEALRQSRISLMNDKAKPHFAHPIFWAPFVVVGEGGTPI